MLDVTWDLFSKHFKPQEVNIKQALVDQYWKVKRITYGYKVSI
jgi:hypothetical protein